MSSDRERGKKRLRLTTRVMFWADVRSSGTPSSLSTSLAGLRNEGILNFIPFRERERACGGGKSNLAVRSRGSTPADFLPPPPLLVSLTALTPLRVDVATEMRSLYIGRRSGNDLKTNHVDRSNQNEGPANPWRTRPSPKRPSLSILHLRLPWPRREARDARGTDGTSCRLCG